MEGLLVLLAITLVILVSISIGKSRGLQEELRLTRLQMQELMKSLARPHGAVPSSHHTEESKPVPPPTFAPPPTPTPVVSVEGEPIALKEPPKSAPYLHPPVAEPVMQDARKPTAEPVRVVTAPPVAPPPPAPPRPSFLERNPDLEKFIGENLISKIGIAILVIGIGLALRYAIGRNMISETGRTLIGLGAGALLLFIAHRLRDKFRAFSSVLVGGGLVVLYFSIAIAF